MPASPIAVIDDVPAMREAAASLIRSLGHPVLAFATADAFLDMAPGGIAAMLCDQQMPGRSGLDLCAALRRGGDETPVLLMTAAPSPLLRARAAAYPAVALIEKPLDAALLAQLLAEALEGAGSSRRGNATVTTPPPSG